MVFKRRTENIGTDTSCDESLRFRALLGNDGYAFKTRKKLNELFSPADSRSIISRLMQNKPLPLTNECDLLTVQLVHSNWTRLCISLINLNYSLVYLKAIDKKANIIPYLSDCLAPPSDWLVFFFLFQSAIKIHFLSQCLLQIAQ